MTLNLQQVIEIIEREYIQALRKTAQSDDGKMLKNKEEIMEIKHEGYTERDPND